MKYELTDLYHDPITVSPERDTPAGGPENVPVVSIMFEDRNNYDVVSMVLDADGTRQFRKLLKKALADLEEMDR